MLLHEIDKLARAGWPARGEGIQDVSCVTTQLVPKETKEGVVEHVPTVTEVAQFKADLSNLYYDATPDSGNAVANACLKFARGGTEFPPIGGDKSFTEGRANQGFIKKALNILVAPAFRSWAAGIGIELEPGSEHATKKITNSVVPAAKGGIYRLPVIGKSADGLVVLGVQSVPDDPVSTVPIDWARSVAVMKKFPAPKASEDPRIPLLQKATGHGRNPFAIEKATSASEKIRLFGAPVRTTQEQLTATFDAVKRRLSMKVNAGPVPDDARLIFFPVVGRADDLAGAIQAMWQRGVSDENDGLKKAPVDVSGLYRMIATASLVYQSGSNSGAGLYLCRRFTRVNLAMWHILHKVLHGPGGLDYHLIGLQTAARMGYLNDKGAPDYESGRKSPACTTLYTELLCRCLDAQPVDTLLREVWSLIAAESKTLAGADLEATEEGKRRSKGILSRQLQTIIPKLYAVDRYLSGIRGARTSEELETAVLAGVHDIKLMKQNTQAMLSPELWADISDAYGFLAEKLESLHTYIAPGRTEAEQKKMLHGAAVGLCITAITQELVTRGRNVTRTSGAHPSHMRGRRLVDIVSQSLNMLENLAAKEPARSAHLGKHVIAALSASNDDLFNLGLVLSFNEVPVTYGR